MRIIPLLFLLMTSTSMALTIDEAGTQRVRKPKLEINVEIDSDNSLMREFRGLMDDVAENDNSVIVIEYDLDGDGSPEKIEVHGDPHEYVNGRKATKFTKIRKITTAESELRESVSVNSCCSGLATGRRQYLNLQLSQSGASGSDGGVYYSDVNETAIAQGVRRAGKAKYKNITLRIDNPDSDLLMRTVKGWDYTSKGGKRNNSLSISIMSGDGKILSTLKTKTKGDGEVKVCGKDLLCGKTDHL